MIAAVEVDPIKLAFVFLGLICTSFYWGTKIVFTGWSGWQKSEFPLSKTRMLTGFPAKLAALAIITFGLITLACGIAVMLFAVFRLRQVI